MMKETISGRGLSIIEVALPEAKARNLNLDLYSITVQEEKITYDGKPESYFVVSFIDKEAPTPPRGPGNPGKIPGLEVKIDKENLKVIKAYFIK